MIIPAKKQVYLNEFNILMEKTVYLPLVSGMLTASSLEVPRIRDEYEFMPFLFHRSSIEDLIQEYENPSVAAFSASMWNLQLNFALAAEVKKRFPECVIVFGGPSVPKNAEEFLNTYSFIDIAVHGEGEIAFVEILEALLDQADLKDIDGISFRDSAGEPVNSPDRLAKKELDELPSPYLNGVFDKYALRRDDYEYQAIFESNRGCPFKCTYCYWGNGPGKKSRHFGLDRIAGEVEWLGRNKIAYVFGADANFGMYKRDMEVAKLFAATKSELGYPKTFRVCYGKNAEDRILEVVKFLDKHGLAKGGTLSRQSNDPKTLENILRSNIKLGVYDRMQMEYNQAGVPIYSEFILGLPGETYTSFVTGIEDTLQAKMHGQLVIVSCTLLPNTLMAEPDYIKEHGIETVRIPLTETHGTRRLPGEIMEYEDIVVATKSSPREDLKRSSEIAWIAQWLHSLRLGFYSLSYLNDQLGLAFTGLMEYMVKVCPKDNSRPLLQAEFGKFGEWYDDLFDGGSQCIFLDNFGNVGWMFPEATYLNLSEKKAEFYEELSSLVIEYLQERGVEYDKEILHEVFLYQQMTTPNIYEDTQTKHEFKYNIAEYFDNYVQDINIDIKKKSQVAVFTGTDFNGQRPAFAVSTIWHGRRDNGFLRKIEWKAVPA